MIEEIVKNAREYFNTGATLDYKFRIEALKKLKKAIVMHEKHIFDALKADLGKSATESYMCEVGMVLSELNYAIKNLKKWMRNEKVRTPLAQFPSKSFIVKDTFLLVKSGAKVGDNFRASSFTALIVRLCSFSFK